LGSSRWKRVPEYRQAFFIHSKQKSKSKPEEYGKEVHKLPLIESSVVSFFKEIKVKVDCGQGLSQQGEMATTD